MSKRLHNESVEFITLIPAGSSLSPKIDLGTARLAGIQMPTAWTPAALSFLASTDGATWGPVKLAGIEYTLPALANDVILLDFSMLVLQFIQLRSGTLSDPVQQTENRTVKLVCFSGA